MVAEFDGSNWLVLERVLIVPCYRMMIDFVLQPLPNGPLRRERLVCGRDDMEYVPTEFRDADFVCRQDGELVLWDTELDKAFTLPETWTDLDVRQLEPGDRVEISLFQSQPVWLYGLNWNLAGQRL